MELYDVLRTTFAAREFTIDPLPDEALVRTWIKRASRRAVATVRAGA